MRKLGQFLAVILVAIAASYGAQRYFSSHQSAQDHNFCVAQNKEAAELNTRVKNNVVLREVLLNFTSEAARARLATYRHSHLPSDLRAARAYRREHNLLAKTPHYRPLPLVHCP